MATLTGTVTVSAAPSYSGSNAVATPSVNPSISSQNTFTSGTGSNQANLLYYNQRTVTGAAETIDLTALTDVFGTTLAWAKVKVLQIFNTATTTGYTLKVGAAASNAWAQSAGPLVDSTDILVVGAGGMLCLTAPVDGFAVDGTHKNLKVDPGTNTITYTLVLLGNS